MHSEGYSTWFVCIYVCPSHICLCARQNIQRRVPTAYVKRFKAGDVSKNASFKVMASFAYSGSIHNRTLCFWLLWLLKRVTASSTLPAIRVIIRQQAILSAAASVFLATSAYPCTATCKLHYIIMGRARASYANA